MLDHRGKKRISPTQRDVNPRCVKERCRSVIKNDIWDERSRMSSAISVAKSVLSGGNYDVDFTLFGPDKRIIKNLQRASYESITIDDTVDGDYKACFGNAFSAMTHKVVFFSWYNASEMEETYGSQVGPDTLFALTTRQIGLNLHNITATQQRERMIHTISYNFGLQLNSRVLYWSIGHSLLVILVGIGQVFLLRSFFSTPTTRHTAPASGSTGPMRYGF
ncbi:transmembrane emp24 domain-containing protein 7 [Clonorchis sinensis]|uniref:Transmembrane emp24 domain-containing protein 7 n=1 Tax=Clonorchis sinensis TaxID=79923 RepID=G7YUE0_CLOSI|nr:transmembrane emp24 domain-containing protein 7 [Clonorchis sinensis]